MAGKYDDESPMRAGGLERYDEPAREAPPVHIELKRAREELEILSDAAHRLVDEIGFVLQPSQPRGELVNGEAMKSVSRPQSNLLNEIIDLREMVVRVRDYLNEASSRLDI